MLAWFASNTLAAAILAGIVLIVCRLCRFRPAVQHALWLLVLVKLLIPAWITWPWSPPDVWRQVRPAESAPRTPATSPPQGSLAAGRLAELDSVDAGHSVFTPADRSSPLSSHRGERGSDASAAPVGSVLMTADPQSSGEADVGAGQWRASFQAWWPGAAWSLWAAGALAVAWLQVVRVRRFRGLMDHGEPPPAWFADELGRLAGRIGVRRPASLWVPQLGHPVVWCLGRPKLLWPTALVDLEPERVRGIILHELAHLRRRDHWVLWLELVGGCLWWWNPLFWYVRRRVRQCAEMACDAWVVWALPDQRRTYAESLIEVVRRIPQQPAVAPAWGALGANRRNFERRLTMIFRQNVPRSVSWGGAVLIGLVAVAALPGWSQEPQNAKQPSEDAQMQSSGSEATGQAVQSSRPAKSGMVYGMEVASEAPRPAEAEAPSGMTPSDLDKRVRHLRALEKKGYVSSGVAQAQTSAGQADEAARPAIPGMGFSPYQEASLAAYPETIIEVFRLEHRDPAEMIEIVTGLLPLVTRGDATRSGEVLVLAVVKRPRQTGLGYVTPSGYPGGGIMPGPAGGPGGGGAAYNYPGSYGGMEGPGMGDEYDYEEAGAYPPSGPSRQMRLTVDQRTRTLIARGPKPLVDQVAALVAALDTSDDDLPGEIGKLKSLRLLKYQHRSTEEMIRVLQELGIQVRVTYVPFREEEARAAMVVGQRGGMFIAAGQASELDQIQRLIQSLDVEAKKTTLLRDGYESEYEPDADDDRGGRRRPRSRGSSGS